ncbi:transglutaminase family protein [Aureliella helgolandensis]|uniref:Transglutaminase-like domain-containing protein n=1 Tax=Aureliella helgolandensis TaxID=2527968 RepID=A0A518G0J8_9BACT|nr:transglutaminase family protein [Aureliella helgolandensis]QDV22123.1 hypothetical protein Q31a_04060 [Aureliella helgolandensis]
MDKQTAAETATYRVNHITTYNYDTPVRVSHNLVMLVPRVEFGVDVSPSYKLTVKPVPLSITRREDYFGNQLHAFSLEENHRQLVVTASGQVKVTPARISVSDPSPSWESVVQGVREQTDPRWMDVCQFQFPSTRIFLEEAYAEYARQCFVPQRPILEAGLELTQRIYQDFEYDSKATHVYTPTLEAFGIRRGVCQDFAHVQIACLRSLGLSARYVSGYLRTHPVPGKERLVGADQSHAWVSLYCGTEHGWVDLDPTNNRICDCDHVPVARGRDYDDVVPVRGVFLGGGRHRIDVSVDVCPVE